MTTLDFNSVPSDPYANTGTVIYILGQKALTLQHITLDPVSSGQHKINRQPHNNNF